MAIRLNISGDEVKARKYIGAAKSQLNILHNQMSFQNLKQGVRRVQLSTDTWLECLSCFGMDTLKIFSMPIEKAAEEVKVLKCARKLPVGWHLAYDDVASHNFSGVDSNFTVSFKSDYEYKLTRSTMGAWSMPFNFQGETGEKYILTATVQVTTDFFLKPPYDGYFPRFIVWGNFILDEYSYLSQAGVYGNFDSPGDWVTITAGPWPINDFQSGILTCPHTCQIFVQRLTETEWPTSPILQVMNAQIIKI